MPLIHVFSISGSSAPQGVCAYARAHTHTSAHTPHTPFSFSELGGGGTVPKGDNCGTLKSECGVRAGWEACEHVTGPSLPSPPFWKRKHFDRKLANYGHPD